MRARALAVVALAGLTVAGAVPIKDAVAAPAKPPASAVLFGLNDHWEKQIIADDRQDKARSGIVGTFLNWSASGQSAHGEAASVVRYCQWANGRGAIPMIDLYPPSNVTLRGIVAGHQDSVLAAYAKALRAWKHVFLFRLFPEMNGPWESYAPGRNGNTHAQFVAAWRHVYRLFHSYGALNVKFVWNPDKQFNGQTASFKQLWPGAQFVDWVALDIYDFNDHSHGRFANARTESAPSVKAIRGLTKTKPLMVAEIGVAPFSGKAAWIRSTFSGLAKLGAKAVVWFDENASGAKWRLDTSASSLQAARTTLAGPSVAWPGHNGGSLAEDEKLMQTGSW